MASVESKEETVPGYMEAAVEAAARAPFDHAGSKGYWDFRIDETEKEAVKDDARRMIEAAEPAIRRDAEEKLEARLLSEAAVDAAEGEHLRVKDMENDEWDAQGFDDGESYGRLMLAAALKATKEENADA